ncbi:hypothetical protein BZA77DRAFT_296364 [Pyronema omphalodes]|nr:hypothetical protein BZA77DRAFT_296364 [Pyronema omphalodes]
MIPYLMFRLGKLGKLQRQSLEGPSSNFLRSLISANKVPTNSYSLTYSDIWPSDGSPLHLESLILGGYDPLANSTTFTSSPISSSNFSLLDVAISHITINLADGTQHTLATFGTDDIEDPSSQTASSFSATLDNSIDYLILPESVIEFFKDTTSAKPFDYSSLKYPLRPRSSVNGGTPYSTYLLYDEEFHGNLIIQLTNGFQVTIPQRLLNRQLLDKDGSEIFISSILGQPPRMIEGLKGKPKAVLGNAFLSQAVLHVDYDNSRFHLAGSKHHTNTVKPVITGCHPSVAHLEASSPSADSDPPTESNSKRTQVILGAVLGSILGVIATLVVILFFLKKRKRRQRLCSGGYNRYSETASTSRPSWIETEAARLEAEEKEAGLAAGSMGSRGTGVQLAGLGSLANTADRGSVGSTGTPYRDSAGSRHFAGFAGTPGERGSGISEAAAATALGGIGGNMVDNGSGGFVGGNRNGGMTVRTDGVIPEGGFTADGIRLPETPSRISVAPSRKSSIPAGRNSYFTEDLDDK